MGLPVSVMTSEDCVTPSGITVNYVFISVCTQAAAVQRKLVTSMIGKYELGLQCPEVLFSV
jgi:hypothetical protein